jgi:AP-1 complex subunit gamma-1
MSATGICCAIVGWNVRASKTIADERAVVQKESAAIRASFREESADHNVQVDDNSLQYL